MTDTATSTQVAPSIVPFRVILADDVLGGTHLPVANIATDLKRLAGELVTGNTVIRVVGYDGANFDPTYVGEWSKLLKEWATEGAQIRYFVQDPTALTRRTLYSLFKETGGRITAFVPGTPEHYTEAEKAVLKRWERQHFVVFEGPDQLWLEGDHSPGETFATDCRYYRPGDAAEQVEFVINRKQFDQLLVKSVPIA